MASLFLRTAAPLHLSCRSFGSSFGEGRLRSGGAASSAGCRGRGQHRRGEGRMHSDLARRVPLFGFAASTRLLASRSSPGPTGQRHDGAPEASPAPKGRRGNRAGPKRSTWHDHASCIPPFPPWCAKRQATLRTGSGTQREIQRNHRFGAQRLQARATRRCAAT